MHDLGFGSKGPLQHLAQRVAREAVEDRVSARDLIIGQTFTEERLEPIGGGGSVFWNKKRRNLVPSKQGGVGRKEKKNKMKGEVLKS